MLRPSAQDVLRDIDESEVDEEIDRVLAMTPAERATELEAAGYEMAKVHADADAMYERLQRTGVEQKAKSLESDARRRSLRAPRERQRPAVVWIAAVAVLVVGAGVLYAMITRPAPEVPKTPSTPSTAPSTMPAEVPPADLVAARDLRTRAFAACEDRLWEDCLARFDDAKKLDPAGDRSPEVSIVRQQAEHALASPPPGPK